MIKECFPKYFNTEIKAKLYFSKKILKNIKEVQPVIPIIKNNNGFPIFVKCKSTGPLNAVKANVAKTSGIDTPPFFRIILKII